MNATTSAQATSATTVLVNQEGTRGFLWHLQVGGSEILSGASEFLTPEHAERDAKRVITRLNTDHILIVEATTEEGEESAQVLDPTGRIRYTPGTFLIERNGQGYGWYGVLVLDQPVAPTAYTRFGETPAAIEAHARALLEPTLVHAATIIEEE